MCFDRGLSQILMAEEGNLKAQFIFKKVKVYAWQ